MSTTTSRSNGPSAGLLSLPDAILHNILSRLPIVDMVHFAAVSWRAHRIAASPSLWRDATEREFPFVKRIPDAKVKTALSI